MKNEARWQKYLEVSDRVSLRPELRNVMLLGAHDSNFDSNM